MASKVRSINGRLARLTTLPDLIRENARLYHRLLDGELTAEVTRTAGGLLARQHVFIVGGSLEERLRALEEQVARQGLRRIQ